jgi:hypothetical protein
MKCYYCGYVGNSLDFLDVIETSKNILEPTPFKVCPKCRRIQ